MRTKSLVTPGQPFAAYTGSKLAIYSKWVYSPSAMGLDFNSPIVDASLGGTDTIIQDFEYYDYVNFSNRSEMGNDYYNALNAVGSNGAAALALLQDMLLAFGNLRLHSSSGTTAAGGAIASILTRTLTGSGLSSLTVSGITAWYAWMQSVLNSASCS